MMIVVFPRSSGGHELLIVEQTALSLDSHAVNFSHSIFKTQWKGSNVVYIEIQFVNHRKLDTQGDQMNKHNIDFSTY